MSTDIRQKGRHWIFYFLIAFGLINIICFTLIISSVVFAFNGVVSAWHFPLAFFMAGFVNYKAGRFLAPEKKTSYFLLLFFIILSITLVCVIFAGFIHDTSADGLVYHQETVYQLQNGWNPFYKNLPDSVSQSIWINHYPKGAEIPQSAIYSVTHKIETGKATNLLLLAGSFMLCVSTMLKLTRFSFSNIILLSFLLSSNPVCINQLLTFYIDGQLACLLLCFLAISVLLCDNLNKYFLFFLSSVMLIAINLKFTAVVFITIFVAGFFLYLFIAKRRKMAVKIFWSIFITGIAAVFIIGYNPYVKNTITYHHPFYPLMGKNSVDIIQQSYPIGFAEKGRLDKFFTSLFSHTDNQGSWAWEERKPRLKIPFTFSKVDIVAARTEDTRIAGFGPLFSGILILSVLLFVVIYILYKKRSALKKISYVSFIVLLSVLVIPEAWWARYVPQFWLIPLLLLFSLEFINVKWVKISKWILYLLLIINISFAFLSVPYRFLSSAQIDYQLSQLKASGEVIRVKWGNARSNRIRFFENKIPFKEEDLDETGADEITGSDSRLIMPANIPPVPKPFFLKWWRQIKPSASQR